MVTRARILLGLGALGIVLVAVIYALPEANIPSATSQSHADVVLTDEGFIPRDVHLVRGGTVTFTTERDTPFWPASDLHPSHGLYSEFDSLRPLRKGESWTFTFDKPGQWGFHDHLRSYFVGVIYVEK